MLHREYSNLFHRSGEFRELRKLLELKSQTALYLYFQLSVLYFAF